MISSSLLLPQVGLHKEVLCQIEIIFLSQKFVTRIEFLFSSRHKNVFFVNFMLVVVSITSTLISFAKKNIVVDHVSDVIFNPFYVMMYRVTP